MDRLKDHGLLLLGVSLAAGLVVSAWIGAAAFRQVRLANHTITVKGYAEKPITSDYGSWSGTFIAEGAELTKAYAALEQHQDIVLTWLENAGVKPGEMHTSAVGTEVVYQTDAKGNPTNQIAGYTLSQQVTVGSAELKLISRVSKESTTLIKRGIRFTSHAPYYFYSKLEEAKVEMLGQAMKNAADRVAALAANSGAKVGRLVQADQGVFQITPPLSTEVEGYGKNDTSSIQKVIKAVITAEFGVE